MSPYKAFHKSSTMKSFALTLVLLALVGVAAAFFKPAEPVQLQAPPMMGTGLDNEHVMADEKITPVCS